jgi:hypothetical protein
MTSIDRRTFFKYFSWLPAFAGRFVIRDRPVVQVIAEPDGEVLYATRARGRTRPVNVAC